MIFNGVKKCFSQKAFSKRIAIILSGCGVFDGSEIHEASICMIHLSRNSLESSLFAPNIEQFHVINHISGKELNEKRNVLVESARIARGNISPLEDLKAENFDALIIPGGFGVAKTLSDFAFKGTEFKVHDQVENSIRNFFTYRKPIGVCCVAPLILSRAIPGVEVTMGGEKEQDGKWPYTQMIENLKKIGIQHFEKNSNEIHIDRKNLVVSTPAYMCGKATLYEIFNGIGLMIDALLKMSNSEK